jgi:hypothetical protein
MPFTGFQLLVWSALGALVIVTGFGTALAADLRRPIPVSGAAAELAPASAPAIRRTMSTVRKSTVRKSRRPHSFPKIGP